MDLTPKFKVGDRVRVMRGELIGKAGRVCQVQESISGYNYCSVRFDGCKTPVWFKNDAVLELINPLDQLSEIK